MRLNARERSANRDLIDTIRREVDFTKSLVTDDVATKVLKDHPGFYRTLRHPAVHAWVSRQLNDLIKRAKTVSSDQLRLFPELPFIPKMIAYHLDDGKLVRIPEEQATGSELDQWVEHVIAKNTDRCLTKNAYYTDYVAKIHSWERVFGELPAGELRRLAEDHEKGKRATRGTRTS